MPSGFGLQLRTVTVDDAEAIFLLRRDPALGRFLGRTVPDVEQQREWIERQRAREGDHYFAVVRESDDTFLGTIAAYNVDLAERECEWGRWVLRPGSSAAVGSATLIFDFIFDDLQLRRSYSLTVAENHQVVSFHDSMGVPRSREVFAPGPGVPPNTNFVAHSLDAPTWRSLRPRAARLAQAVERLL